MELDEVMAQLEALGSEQTRKTWRRHGVAEPMFGVLFGDLTKLQKRIKTNHTLAGQLWQSGNHDARLLACMVADAKTMSTDELTAWAASLKDSSSGESLAGLASKTPMAASLCQQWLAAEKTRRMGWTMVAHQAKQGKLPDDAVVLDYIAQIEATIHQSENWARRGMMYTLIAIGGYNASLRHATEAAVARIGPVAFDPGPTACEFPDPLPYIAKIWARKKT
ncbi:MAG: hypothetical protein RL748_3321 [Pseudomonadota bacterium]